MRRIAPHRALCLSAALLALAACAPALSQDADDHPRTAWGEPDISGVYSEYTTASIERPEAFGDREFLTQEEFEAREQRRADPADEVLAPGTAADVHYDMDAYALSADEGFTSTNMRTSIVVSPANGRIPPLLPQAQARAAAYAEWRRGREFDGPEFRSLTERCIAYPATLPPILPFGYNSNLQIFQSPGQVLIQGEMGDPRIIPTDGRALPEDLLPQWSGTSVGRWEGETLVVETAGFHPQARWRGSSRHLHVTERFTRLDHDTIEYAFTVEDPETWAEPWSGVYPLTEMPGAVLFEYACTEGNYGMANILSGARATENESATE
jgi:hypothetical protein